MDLGLPSGLKWATCNVGAENPQDAGLYFAWGETTGYAKGSGHVFNETNYTAGDITTGLELVQDAARINMGGNWRMPTQNEWVELFYGTIQKWTYDYDGTGVAGCIIKSKTNDNQIFLPGTNWVTNGGTYWSSTIDSDHSGYSWMCYFDEDDDINAEEELSVSGNNKFKGSTIRAVCE